MSTTTTLSDKVQNQIKETELDITTSGQYFKPNPGTTYVIEIDLEKHGIKPVENDRFKDANGKPLKRYELVIVHVNNQKEQTWTVSKTVCLQIIQQIRKGFKVVKLTRTGADRSTTYQIEGVS
jgi:hypothetical protein